MAESIIHERGTELEVIRLTGTIGAEIRGITLSGDLKQEIVEQIRSLLWEHKVIFFRGQEHLTDQEQEAFAKLFGELYQHPVLPVREGSSSILELNSEKGARANTWHTDLTYVDSVPHLSVLRGVVIPEYGGDTIWANTQAAYEALPDELKVLADQLWAVHDNALFYDTLANQRTVQNSPQEYTTTFQGRSITAVQPVVHVHYGTGKKSLILGDIVTRIIGRNQLDSSRLFQTLQEHVIQPEHQVRWKWRVGDVAIWDNHASQHYAVLDYGAQHRVVRRVTVGASVLVNVNGKTGKDVHPER